MANEYKKGQVWSYTTREGEEKSTILILDTERYQFPERVDVVYIAINNLQMVNPLEETGFSEEIEFLPFSKKSIDNSVTELLQENVWVHAYEEGYFEWKKAFMQSKGGIFDMTVKTAVKSTEQTLEQVK